MDFEYRIIKREYRKKDSDEVLITTYFISEVTYDENGKIFMMSEGPEGPYGDTVSDLMISWMDLVHAFNKPIINFDDIPEEGSHNPLLEIMDDIKDKEGENRPIKELEKEGKLKSYNSVAELMSSVSGDTIENCEKRMMEFREEEKQRLLNNETSYAIKNIGQPISSVVGNIIEEWIKDLDDEDLEYN